MKKGLTPIIIIAVVAAIGGSVYFVMNSVGLTLPGPNDSENFVDAVSSGPVTILQYEHKLGENVFVHIRGVGLEEKGNIRFFTPEGVLYKTVNYDGTIKQDFNQYFKPETSRILEICTPEELIGEWTVTFDNNVYPPLKFKVLDELLSAGVEQELGVVC